MPHTRGLIVTLMIVSAMIYAFLLQLYISFIFVYSLW
jgi:hypothetical protein